MCRIMQWTGFCNLHAYFTYIVGKQIGMGKKRISKVEHKKWMKTDLWKIIGSNLQIMNQFDASLIVFSVRKDLYKLFRQTVRRRSNLIYHITYCSHTKNILLFTHLLLENVELWLDAKKCAREPTCHFFQSEVNFISCHGSLQHCDSFSKAKMPSCECSAGWSRWWWWCACFYSLLN